MFEKIRFYLRYSFNDLRVNGQRTLFALLCIAAGVAAIVSLQTLGVMIENSLTGSLQESNGGDIQILPVEDNNISNEQVQQGQDAGVIHKSGGGVFGGRRDEMSSYYFSPDGVEQIQAWFDTNYPGSEVTTRQVIAGGHGPMGPSSISSLGTKAEQLFVWPYFVDAGAYPLYGTRDSGNGQSLGELLDEPTNIVISRNLADTLNVDVGDSLRVNGAQADFTLTGIIPTDSESGFENIGGSLFGYYYLDAGAVDLFEDTPIEISQVFVRLADPSQVEAAGEAFMEQYPYLYTSTTLDLEEQNLEVSDMLNQLVTIMGLVSLLIGGIGIVNTMQVVVSRRSTEIAVLKTIGLEGEQVTTLFMAQAVLMGVFGSVIGIGLGWLTAYAIRGIAETFIAQSLTFRITAGPALTGGVVGVLVTTIFGFMPTLAAGQVRPNLVLRPSEALVPTAGRLRSFLALIGVIVALSLVAQPLLGDLLDNDTIRLIAAGVGVGLGLLAGLSIAADGLFGLRGGLRWVMPLAGLAAGAGIGYAVPALLVLVSTCVVVFLLYVLLWALIWLVGRFFPAWWLVDLKVALRSMLATKSRGASTLLALVVGVFTLSLITMLTDAIAARFEEIMNDETGGNVLVFASGQEGVQAAVEQRLDSLDGVHSYTAMGAYSVDLVSMEDASTGEIISVDVLQARVEAEIDVPDFGPGHNRNNISSLMSSIDARGVDSNLPDVPFYSGRQLTPDDAGQPVLVIPANDATLAAGFEVGDRLTFRLLGGDDPVELTFEIVGMLDRTGSQISVGATSPNYAPFDAFPEGMQPDTVNAVVDIDEGRIDDLRLSMNEVPGVFVLESRLLNDLINRVINQFASFPMLVASLALVVGGIVIANSVALSTLERRREIGIMKAVGLQRERVLGMLLVENGLMGLISGLIGVGLGGIVLLLLMAMVFGGILGDSIPYLAALSLMGLCVLIALLAAIVTAWGATGEKPLNVLRYE
ncbi:MAG: ABC transporter permease [Anaerolineae bacterium]|nr:ABC transporter permease [Anaerolineae bacterium]